MLPVIGDTAMDATVLACTVSVTAALVTPPSAAVIMLAPVATPAASPLALMVATEVVAEVQVAVAVTFPVVPLL